MKLFQQLLVEGGGTALAAGAALRPDLGLAMP